MIEGKVNLRGGSNSEFETIPEGVYTAQVIDVVKKTWFSSYTGENVDGFEYKFAILDDEELPESGESTRGRYLWYRVTNSLSKRSNFYKLACAALGKRLDGDEIDPDSDDCVHPNDLVGEQVLVVVENNEKDGNVYANVNSVSIAKEELEPVEVEDGDVTASEPVTSDEDDEEDDIDSAIEALEDDEDFEEVDEEEDDDDEETDEDEDELAELEAAAKKARKRLAAKKKAAKAKKSKPVAKAKKKTKK